MTAHPISMATIDLILNLDDALLPDGIVYFNRDDCMFYCLDKTSSRDADQLTVFNTSSEVGKWIRNDIPDINNLQEANQGLTRLSQYHTNRNQGTLIINSGGLNVLPFPSGTSPSVTISENQWSQAPSVDGEIWIQSIANPPHKRVWIGKYNANVPNSGSWQELALGSSTVPIVQGVNPNNFNGSSNPAIPAYLGQLWIDNIEHKAYIAVGEYQGNSTYYLPWREIQLGDLLVNPNWVRED